MSVDDPGPAPRSSDEADADTVPPRTGDAEVDRALADLDAGLQGTGEEQLEALTRAHRRLQARLSEPTEQPAPPGQARPGPR